MISNNRGFSLIELITVLSIVAVLAAIALPAFNAWMENATYKETAQELLQSLSKARSLAISTNRQYRVELQLGARRYRILAGEKSAGTNFASPADYTEVQGWTPVSSKVALRHTAACNDASDRSFDFNPNGTAIIGGDLCIMEANAPAKEHFKISISLITGRPTIQ